MPNIVALIYSSEFDERNYGSLCKHRPDYMLPFGGRYRIIDFTLSNLTNHDISRVVLYSDRMMRSAIDHIGNGKSWELNRRSGGLLINSPSMSRLSEIETFYDAIGYFEDHPTDYVYIKNPMYINKADITDAYEKIQSEDLDCLIFSTKTEDEDGNYLNRKIISTNKDGRPVSVGLNLGISDNIDLFLGSILIKTEVFLKILRLAMQKDSKMSLLNAIFTLGEDLNIDFYRHEKSFEIISDIDSFFDANLKLLDKDVFDQLFYEDGLVYTKSKDEPSTSYTKDSKVRNSLIANGSVIKGRVENSIIFRGVTIGKDAVIKNSVIFQDTEIGDGAILNFVITDKKTNIQRDTKLFGNRSHPFVTSKNELLEKGN
ncbi:MAG: glucose-1-phosphate adenylyltransferase subunit GlgD [Anaerococcus sp.]|nr:glucose-1-phosphate adenylyltransferase subunit GlgD [Anaerococcus sp.]